MEAVRWVEDYVGSVAEDGVLPGIDDELEMQVCQVCPQAHACLRLGWQKAGCGAQPTVRVCLLAVP
eukprot:7517264-Pyramimonas_sp.AAC.1